MLCIKRLAIKVERQLIITNKKLLQLFTVTMLQARYSNDWDIRPCSFLNSRPLLCSVSSVSLSGEVMVFPAAPFRTVYN